MRSQRNAANTSRVGTPLRNTVRPSDITAGFAYTLVADEKAANPHGAGFIL